MKIVAFVALILFLTTEIRAAADLSSQPIKIQTLVKKLFNLKPNTSIAHSLGKPLELKIDQEQVPIESQEVIDVIYQFKNVTVYKLNSDSQRPKIHYTSLICDFHQQLKLCQSIDPPDLEIKGIYELKKTPESQKSAEFFVIKQYNGSIIYQISSDGTKDTDIVYKDQEMKFGETSKYHIMIVRAIGGIVNEVNNKTANKLNQNNNLPNKIQDFEHIFPFLSGSLSAINKTALRSEDENVYSINNTITERLQNMYWSLPYVVIRGLNNFKQAKIIAYDEDKVVRFNMTLITNKLKGYFEWRFGKNESTMISQPKQEFIIDNLTVTANTRFGKDWSVDKVEIDLGSITLVKDYNASELYPDINEFAYQIFHDNLQTLIKAHLKQIIHDAYSQPAKSNEMTTFENQLDTTSSSNRVNNTNQTTTDGRLIIDLWNTTTTATLSTILPNDTTLCKDDRRFWQKIYRRNKCKQSKIQPETDNCTDKRWWFQKPFVRKNCAKNMSLKNVPTTQQVPEAKGGSDLQLNEKEKCVDKRWWFQKAFIRNKCKPE